MATVKGTEDMRRVMSASSLIGDSVVNSKGEDLGSIEEIMLHIESGRIAYAVLSFGGFLGLGDKLFAIPWEALVLDEDNKQFILDVDKDKLEKAPGFNKDHWPDMADPLFGKEIYGYYGYEPFWETRRQTTGRDISLSAQKEYERGCLETGDCS
jgi:sporulation protein YlmC with PRC-barrel domain